MFLLLPPQAIITSHRGDNLLRRKRRIFTSKRAFKINQDPEGISRVATWNINSCNWNAFVAHKIIVKGDRQRRGARYLHCRCGRGRGGRIDPRGRGWQLGLLAISHLVNTRTLIDAGMRCYACFTSSSSRPMPSHPIPRRHLGGGKVYWDLKCKGFIGEVEA